MQPLIRSLVAAACLSGTHLFAADGAAIQVTDPYVRAVPPGQPNSAAFMTLSNTGDEPRALVAAESDAAATVELHTHGMVDGMMRMRRVDRIELPAGEQVALQPGGLHVMLIGLTQQLEPGMDVALTLVLNDGSRLQLTAPVRRIDVGGMGGHGGH
jgi:hypothetical protein